MILYRIGLQLLSPWNAKAARWLKGRNNIHEKITAQLSGNTRPVIWMHCASLGEFEQGRPLLEALKLQYPLHKLALSFFSPSGYEIKKNDAIADYIFYLPADNRKNARFLIQQLNPQLVLWVKYEYWYYYLSAINESGRPLLLISGIFREGQVFFKWYGALHRKMLSFFSYFFVQNALSKKLLSTIHINNTAITGDTRFDRVIAIAEEFENIPGIQQFTGNHFTIVAGSTWPEDEEVLDHFANIHPDLKFIIAPHEIGENHLLDIEKLFKNAIRYSQWEAVDAQEKKKTHHNVLIIDNIGMLARIYKYAHITYVGGGFGGDGVHNVLEAAVYGKPVIFGPVYSKFQEAIDLVEIKGAFSVESALALETLLEKLIANPSETIAAGTLSKNYVYQHKGATHAILQYIQENRLLTN